jgi:lysophospholipase L1-like esterase
VGPVSGKMKNTNKKIALIAIGIAVMIVASTMVVFPMMTFHFKKLTSQQIRVACIGDSITEETGYPYYLRMMLGADYWVGNFGVSGSTVSLSSNKPYMDQTQFQRAKEFQPDIVVIMLGTNDANPDLQQYNESFEDDYSKLVASFQELDGEQQIWVVKSPPIFNNTMSLNTTYFSENIIPHIDNLANQLKLPEIDVYDALSDQSGYFPDGIHPNSDGAALIASEVYNKITIIPPNDSSSIPESFEG